VDPRELCDEVRRYQLDDLAKNGGVAMVWSDGFIVFHTLPSGSD
jgi:hypothetical protein